MYRTRVILLTVGVLLSFVGGSFLGELREVMLAGLWLSILLMGAFSVDLVRSDRYVVVILVAIWVSVGLIVV